MSFEEIYLLVNIVLCILSFILAAISVVTIIISLKQNNKMIHEMQKEHEFSLQPIVDFSNTTFVIEKPRLFYTCPEDEYSIQSRFYFQADVRNISPAVAVNFICFGVIGVVNGENMSFLVDQCSEKINILADNSEKINFMFSEGDLDLVFNNLREKMSTMLPQCQLIAVFRNTAGGAFRMKKRYLISPKENVMDEIRKWHSIVSSAQVDYKEGLKCLSMSHGKDDEKFNDLKEIINQRGGDNKEILIDCVELDEFFTYEPISIEEYTKIVGNAVFPTYVGNRQSECLFKEDSK